MLDFIINNTNDFISNVSKSHRKKLGQFFTSRETAEYMASIVNKKNKKIRILDPGAGSGILTGALIDKLQTVNEITDIHVDLYENDLDIIPLLKSNLDYIKKNTKKKFTYNLIEENFIVRNEKVNNKESNQNKGIYDVVICNPPYKKINKDSIEAKIMSNVIYGQPNLYFLFMALSIRLMKRNAEMIFIVPRSWTSGAYFKKFRKFFLKETKITNMHLFESRKKVFDSEKVLQEAMIIKAIKSNKEPNEIEITTSTDNNIFENIRYYLVEYDLCVEKNENNYIYLPTSEDDINVLKTINPLNIKLTDLGLKLKTGRTVDFRVKQLLFSDYKSGLVPLITSSHFKEGIIEFPSTKVDMQYISKANQSLLQKNTNYLLLKRFSSKEEPRRLQPALFLKEYYNEYEFISTENHINYFCSILKNDVEDDLLYGLYAIYNSTLYDKYYRILNGSTQVNATEINAIPIPNEKSITNMGKKLREYDNISTKVCDDILKEEWIYV